MTGVYTSMMGARLRAIRRVHRKSLRVVAAGAGISPAYLSQLESGKRALDRHSVIMALADALGIMPDTLTLLPVPAPANGGVDSAIEAVRQALLIVCLHHPAGPVVPLEELRARATATVRAYQSGERPGEVGAALAELIRDLHGAIEAGHDTAELLELAMLVHTQATLGWLRIAGAPVDLRLQVGTLARHVARDLDTPSALGVAAWGGLSAMISGGLLDLARIELDEIDVPTTSPEAMQLAGMLALCRSLLATVDSRPADAAAAFEQAAQLAERTGEGDAFGMGFGPTTVGLWRMYSLLDVGDYQQAAHIGAGLNPLGHLPRLGQADYWVTYARALARLRGRRDHAALALLRAEEICPHRLLRDPFARDLVAELLVRSPDKAADRELRGLAQRARLPRVDGSR